MTACRKDPDLLSCEGSYVVGRFEMKDGTASDPIDFKVNISPEKIEWLIQGKSSTQEISSITEIDESKVELTLKSGSIFEVKTSNTGIVITNRIEGKTLYCSRIVSHE